MQQKDLYKLGFGILGLGVAAVVVRDMQHAYSDPQRKKLISSAMGYVNSAEKLICSRNCGEVVLNAFELFHNALEYRAAQDYYPPRRYYYPVRYR